MATAAKRCCDCVAEGITTNRKLATTRAGKLVPGPRCATHHRARRKTTSSSAWEKRLKALYGISADEYRQVLAYQQGRCFICQRATGAVRRLAVDHDHSTGFLRGCLCATDNKLLGHARDSIEFFERCIEYLKNPPAVVVLGERIAPIEAARLTMNEGDRAID